jgi:hypothetical protein
MLYIEGMSNTPCKLCLSPDSDCDCPRVMDPYIGTVNASGKPVAAHKLLGSPLTRVEALRACTLIAYRDYLGFSKVGDMVKATFSLNDAELAHSEWKSLGGEATLN